MTTATMDDLRQQLQTTEQTEALRKEKIFRQLAKKLADNEPVSADELKAAGIVSIQSAKLVCTECGSDTCRVVKAAGTNQSCVCDGCGHSWKQPVPAEIPEGCRPFSEIQEAVQEIHQRRAWKEQLKNLPEQRTRLAEIDVRQRELVEAVEKAIQARDEFARNHEGESFVLRAAVAKGDEITESVVRSCDSAELNAQKRELDRQRGIVASELASLGTDLWGYSAPGTFSSVAVGTFGEEILSKLQTIVSVSGLYEVARAHYPEHFDHSPLAGRKSPESFGEWLNPNSKAFQNVIRGELHSTERDAALKAYKALYTLKVKPTVARWVQAHLNLRDIDAQYPTLLQQMLEA